MRFYLTSSVACLTETARFWTSPTTAPERQEAARTELSLLGSIRRVECTSIGSVVACRMLSTSTEVFRRSWLTGRILFSISPTRYVNRRSFSPPSTATAQLRVFSANETTGIAGALLVAEPRPGSRSKAPDEDRAAHEVVDEDT